MDSCISGNPRLGYTKPTYKNAAISAARTTPADMVATLALLPPVLEAEAAEAESAVAAWADEPPEVVATGVEVAALGDDVEPLIVVLGVVVDAVAVVDVSIEAAELFEGASVASALDPVSVVVEASELPSLEADSVAEAADSEVSTELEPAVEPDAVTDDSVVALLEQ